MWCRQGRRCLITHHHHRWCIFWLAEPEQRSNAQRNHRYSRISFSGLHYCLLLLLLLAFLIPICIQLFVSSISLWRPLKFQHILIRQRQLHILFFLYMTNCVGQIWTNRKKKTRGIFISLCLIWRKIPSYSSSLCFILSHLLTVFYHQSSCCQYGSILFLFSSEILKSRLHSTLYIKYVLHMQLVHKYKSKVKEYHIGVLSVQYSTYHTYYRSRHSL